MKINFLRQILFYAILFCLNDITFCQYYSDLSLDTLNKVDEEGRKTGYWVEFLSKNFIDIKNKKKAVYFRYVQYNNGKRFESILIPYTFRKLNIKTEGNKEQVGQVILLDGTYNIYNKNYNKLYKRVVFKNGHLLHFVEFYDNGSISLDVDYENKYNNYKYSCFAITYNEEGEIEMKFYLIIKDGKIEIIRLF